MRDAASLHFGEVDPEESILEAILFDSASARAAHLDGCAIFHVAPAHSTEHEAADGHAVGGDRHDGSLTLAVEHCTSISDDGQAPIHDNGRLAIDAGVHGDEASGRSLQHGVPYAVD